MKISVIIPVHNSRNTLVRCVESVLEQECDDLEIILIENNSEDDSFLLCEELSDTYEQIHLIRTRRRGTSWARNEGLEYATGEIICFCDSDDFMEKNALKTVLDEFENSDVEMLITGFYRKTESVRKIEKVIPKRKGMIPPKKVLGMVLNDPRIMGSVCNKFYKSALIGRIRFSPELAYCEDTHFNIAILSNNPRCKCKIIDTPLYYYVYNPWSVTNDVSLLFDENDNLRYLDAMRKILRDFPMDFSLKIQVEHAITCLSINTWRGSILSRRQKEKLRKNMVHNIWGYICVMPQHTFKYDIKRLGWIIKAMMLPIKTR